MAFLEEFVATARERALFPLERNRVVVACSGGPDSVFLMYLLWSCREALGLDLSVLTCDHGLRPEAEAETREVQQRAWTLGLPCQVRRLDVEADREAGESIEMAARRLRRLAYLEAAADFGARRVALGHHMDDQAETVLLKLARGTGPRGASGMDWVTPLTPGVELVRPLLNLRRRDIGEWLARWGIQPVEDPSNRDDRHLRNRVRHEILPLMTERLNPATVRHLAEFAERQRRLEAWVSEEARERGRGCVREGELLLEPWRFLPEVPRERILMGWLEEQGADLASATQGQLGDFFRDLAAPVSYARRWRIGGLAVRVDQDVLTRDEFLEPPDMQTLPLPGKLVWESLHRPLTVSPADCVDLEASSFHDFQGPLTAFVRPPSRGAELKIRPPKPGDRYAPLGLKGSIKLSDLFINEHLPAKYRPVWPVVVCGDEIVWVPGFRVADAWRVDKTPCLKLTLSATEG